MLDTGRHKTAIFSKAPVRVLLRIMENSQKLLTGYFAKLRDRSVAIPRVLDRRINSIALAWSGAFLLFSLLRILTSPTASHGMADWAQIALPYLVIAVAPLAGYSLASASFRAGAAGPQPSLRLSFYGSWRQVSLPDARSSPVFGPAGFMASLLIGLLLNVVMRSGEFLLAMPALNHHAPLWGTRMFMLMTADVAIMGFFYMVCFAMALRTVPLFPRMLLFAWLLDVALQLYIAQQVGATPGLPADVAGPLKDLLEGNITKVMISAVVWLPYLILSDRVNITYRLRIPAASKACPEDC